MVRNTLEMETPWQRQLPRRGKRNTNHKKEFRVNCSMLAFQDTQFEVVDRDGRPWLKAADIARALGYSRADKVTQIYDRNQEEFTDTMTLILNLRVKGFGGGESDKPVRIFSLRGAHLLAMLSRTRVAKAFRRWVLDVLDREVATHESRPAVRQVVTYRTPPGDLAVDAEALEDLRLHLRKIRESALVVVDALGPLAGRGGEVATLHSYVRELPLVWGALQPSGLLMSQPVVADEPWPPEDVDDDAIPLSRAMVRR
ncbi:putative phage antirepressor, BRO family [Pseudogulbenkiania sp. NH8B]|uniref:BRO-N domain-containing protein n=1 Tax=Pseudogulbenkiania sp. (strain NH8B) TaxID=748280 RepID=UPI0002279580|nr:BRO family protein [Pseudogulbenkiania sp. NH8B]BAK75411.1 putative phage antirepressor, BRO family [Pseudogulbenkiania sp. NH8B]